MDDMSWVQSGVVLLSILAITLMSLSIIRHERRADQVLRA